MVSDEHVRILDAPGLQADGNVGIAVEVVEHIHDVGIGLAHPVHNDADEVAALHVHIAVKHHQGEEIVGGGAHVAVQDDTDVLLLIVGLDIDVLGGHINRVLTIRAGKGHGGRQAVFREHPGAVEVVLVLLGIVPAPHEVLVGAGVPDYSRQALAVETVLRFLVRDHQPFGGLAHRVEVKSESFGMHLAHGIDDVDEILVRQVVLLRPGGEDGGGAERQQDEQFFHIIKGIIRSCTLKSQGQGGKALACRFLVPVMNLVPFPEIPCDNHSQTGSAMDQGLLRSTECRP